VQIGALLVSKFQETLLRALERSGKTQVDVAREANVAPSLISTWLRGGSANPDPAKVFAVERVLDLSPGQLSRHLGYVPVEAVTSRGRPPLDEWLADDPDLDDWDRGVILEIYEKFTDRQRLGRRNAS
jgi:transcriptional regulator with XRE-family HTH domain